MPAPRPSSSGRSSGAGSREADAGARTTKAADSGSARKRAAAPARSRVVTDGLANFVEQLANRVLAPLDAVLITRERIQETLEEAAERGRLTRSDANDLVAELFKRGRQQTDDLLSDIPRLLGSATKRARKIEPVDRIVRGADRARRTVGVGPTFPIGGYEDMTAGQVEKRLDGLKPAELRRVRDYERKHANRKTVLDAIEKALR